jgi:hypothetical protein
MSTLSSALAASLQNSNVIGPLITGVISGRNFDLQDSMISTTPYACIAVIDLPSHETPMLGAADGIVSGQIEVRVISSISEDKAKEIAEEVKTHLRPLSRLPWGGGVIPFGVTGWDQVPDTADDLSFWIEILTVNYKAAA